MTTSSYGFTVNASAVSDEKSKVSVGVNFKDSNGFTFDAKEDGTVEDVTNTLYQKFVSQYIASRAATKAKKEMPAVQEKAAPSEDMVRRLRKLERENLDLKAQIASAKYKDPNYNKPSDADKLKAKENDAKGAASEKATCDAINKATEEMKRRLRYSDAPLKDVFSRGTFDELLDMLGAPAKLRKGNDDLWWF